MEMRERRTYLLHVAPQLALTLAAALLLLVVGAALAQTYPELPLERAVEARLDADDTQHWYQVQTPDAGALTVSAESDGDLGIDLRLYHEQSVLHSDTGGARQARVVLRPDLGAGTYLVRIDRVTGGGRYTLRASHQPSPYADDPEPNDRVEDAATLATDQPFEGRLGYRSGERTDTDDWFRLTVALPGRLSVPVEAEPSLALDARLYAANGSSVLDRDTGGGRSSRVVERADLAPGTYFVRLTRVAGHGGYRLQPVFEPQPVPIDAEPNDSADEAAVLVVNQMHSGQLGYTDGSVTDRDDWFTFELDEPGGVHVTVQADETLALDARLYAANGSSVLDRDTGGGRSSRLVERADLAPGTYFVRLTRVTGYGGYHLTPAFVAVPGLDEREGATSADEATAIEPNGVLRGILGYVSAGGTAGDAYHRFHRDGSGPVTIAATAQEPLAFDLRLYDEAGRVLQRDTGGGHSHRSLTLDALEPGSYVVRVTRVRGHGPYEIQVRTDRDGLAPHPERIDFPASALGAEPLVAHAAVLNTSASDVDVLEVSVHGAGGFELRSAPDDLPAGAAGAFVVVFTPAEQGPADATLHVATSAGTVTIALHGEGFVTFPGVGLADAHRADPPPADVAPADPYRADPPPTHDPSAGAPEDDDAWPSLRVEHVSGAVLTAPAGTLPSDCGLVLETLVDPLSAEPFVHLGSALAVRADAGAPVPAGPVELLLPSPGEHTTVLFYSLGEWIRLPAETVTRPGGDRALALRIDRVPLPWVVSLAELPSDARGTPDLASGTGLHATIARLEQLRITDPDAMAAELARLDTEPSAAATFGGEYQRASQPGTLLRVADTPSRNTFELLQNARLKFLHAYAAVHQGGPAFAPIAANHYVDGVVDLHDAAERITRLSFEARDRSFADGAGADLDSRLDGFDRRHVYGGTLTVAEIADYYAGTFAPWGLELTRAIVDSEQRALGGQFDVRILPFYGSERFTNLIVPRRFTAAELLALEQHLPRAMARGVSEVARAQQIIEGQASASVTLRLYSPTLLDITRHDLYSAAKTTLGGGMWLYGIASLGATVSAGTAIPIGTGVVAAYNLFAPLLEYMFIEPRADRWHADEYVSKTGSLTAYGAGRLIGSVAIDPTGRGLTTATGLTDLVLTALIDYDTLADVNELRAFGMWGVRNPAAWFYQRSNFYAPPVEVVFNVAGPTTLRASPEDPQRGGHWPATRESYVLGGFGSFSVFVDHDAVADGGIRNFAFDPGRSIRQRLFGLPLHDTPFRAPDDTPAPVSRWARLHHLDEAPHVQVLRWTLEEATLEAWRVSAGLDDVESLLERMTLVVRPVGGGTPFVGFYRASRLEAADVTLARALASRESSAERRTFAVAVTERADATPRNAVEHVDFGTTWNEASVGAWSALMVFAPQGRYGQFELEYEVMLLDRGEEVMRFPVGFAYRAVDSVNVEFVPTRGYSDLPPRKIEVSTVRPDVEHDFDIAVREVDHRRTHSAFVFAVEDRSSLDLSGFTLTWTIVSERGERVALDEQQGAAVVTVALPFDPADAPDGAEGREARSPFDVLSPGTNYTVSVEVSEDGQRVDVVDATVNVPGPYTIRIDQPGRH